MDTKLNAAPLTAHEVNLIIDSCDNSTLVEENRSLIAEWSYVAPSEICRPKKAQNKGFIPRLLQAITPWDSYQEQGRFASKDIPAGTPIGRYTGIHHLMKSAIDMPDEVFGIKIDLRYVFSIATPLADGRRIGIFTKSGLGLINHSETPNLEYDPRSNRFHACRDITKDEELSWCYGNNINFT